MPVRAKGSSSKKNSAAKRNSEKELLEKEVLDRAAVVPKSAPLSVTEHAPVVDEGKQVANAEAAKEDVSSRKDSFAQPDEVVSDAFTKTDAAAAGAFKTEPSISSPTQSLILVDPTEAATGGGESFAQDTVKKDEKAESPTRGSLASAVVAVNREDISKEGEKADQTIEDILAEVGGGQGGGVVDTGVGKANAGIDEEVRMAARRAGQDARTAARRAAEDNHLVVMRPMKRTDSRRSAGHWPAKEVRRAAPPLDWPYNCTVATVRWTEAEKNFDCLYNQISAFVPPGLNSTPRRWCKECALHMLDTANKDRRVVWGQEIIR